MQDTCAITPEVKLEWYMLFHYYFEACWMIFYRNIEDILAEKGESVKRLTESDSLEFLVKDLANRIEKGKPSEDED